MGFDKPDWMYDGQCLQPYPEGGAPNGSRTELMYLQTVEGEELAKTVCNGCLPCSACEVSEHGVATGLVNPELIPVLVLAFPNLKIGDRCPVCLGARIVRRCVVRGRCLALALDRANEEYGVWGGTTESERKTIKREARRERLAAEEGKERQATRPAVRAVRGRAAARARSCAPQRELDTPARCVAPVGSRKVRLVRPRRLLAASGRGAAHPGVREFRAGADFLGRPRHPFPVSRVPVGDGLSERAIQLPRLLPRLVGDEPRQVPEVPCAKVVAPVRRSTGVLSRVIDRGACGRPGSRRARRVQIVRARDSSVGSPRASEAVQV